MVMMMMMMMMIGNKQNDINCYERGLVESKGGGFLFVSVHPE